MGSESIKEIMELLMEFLPLFHQKLGAQFHRIEDPRYPCTKNQNRAIMILKYRGKTTPSYLGKCLDMRKGSLTSLIDSLDSMGLVRREADPSDRRRVIINLTAEGEAYVNKRYREFEKALDGLFSSFSETEVEGFKKSLRSVVETMKKLEGSK